MNYLEFLRRQHGWTQQQLGNRLKLHPITVSRIENGWYAKPPAGLDAALRRVFGQQWGFVELMRPVRDVTGPVPQTGDRA